MTEIHFDSTTQTAIVAGIAHLTNPQTGKPWQDENEAQQYFAVPDQPTEAPIQPPHYQFTEIDINGEHTRLVGNIQWVKVDTDFTLTAKLHGVDPDTPLPDELANTELMVMCERVVDGQIPVDDMRFIARIADGKVTLTGRFVSSGNYVISAARINRGLERIGLPFGLEFETIEFDAYVAA